MANNRFNKQVTPKGYKIGGRAMKMGGGMSTARKDMESGYYKDDMGMRGGAMYKKGGSVKKKKQGYKDRKDESIAMRIKNKKTRKGTRKKTKGEKINEMLIKAQKETPGLKKGGRVKKKNTRRMNRLEELGRVDAEKAYTKKGKRNLKAEKRRVVRELKSNGGSAGAAIRGKGCEIR